MHDGQLWIYIIIGLIYFLTRMSKKKAPKQSARPSRPQQRRPSPAGPPVEKPRPQQKPISFEEMLREIMEAKQEAAKPAPAPASPPTPPAYVDYDDQLEDESEDIERVERERSQEPAAKSYAEGLQEAFNRPALEGRVSAPASSASDGRFKTFENSAENRIFGEYINDLKDPEGFKRHLY